MKDTVNKTISEKKLEKAKIKLNVKFLRYTPVVALHLSDNTEGII